MKILRTICSTDPKTGGPIAGIRNITPPLSKLGYQTEILSLDDPLAPWLKDFFCPVHALGPGSYQYGYTKKWTHWLRENSNRYGAVIIHGLWQYNSFGTWRALKEKKSPPYFVYAHGMLDPWFKHHYPLKHLKKWLYWPWAEYRVLRDAKGVLFTSEQERVLASQSFWLYKCKEQVVGYGTAGPQRENFFGNFHETYPVLKDRRFVLFLGRLHEKKGLTLLLKAYKRILSESFCPFDLVIAGPANNPHYEMKLHRFAQFSPSQVHFLPMLEGDQKWGILQAADAFILPSHQENFGIAVAEALACGVPVLISDKVNICREIEKASAGYVKPDTIKGTYQLLKKYLLTPRNQWKTMKTNARFAFNQYFSIDQAARNLAKILTFTQT